MTAPTYATITQYAPLYQSNLNAIFSENTGINDWVPTKWDYSGNGKNDLFEKAEAYRETFHLGDPAYAVIDPGSLTQATLNEAVSLIQEANNAMAGQPDLLGTTTQSLADKAAQTHDIQLAQAQLDNSLPEIISADVTLATSSVSAFFQDGNPYDLVQGAVVGTVGMGLHVIDWGVSEVSSLANNIINDIGGIFRSNDAPTSDANTFTSDEHTGTSDASSAGDTYDYYSGSDASNDMYENW